MNTRVKDNFKVMTELSFKAEELAETNPVAANSLRKLSSYMFHNPSSHVWCLQGVAEDLLGYVNEVLSDITFDTTYPYASEIQIECSSKSEVLYIVQGVLAKDLDGIINQKEEQDHE